MQWDVLAASSHFQASVAIRDELAAGHLDEAAVGLEELIEALSRSERRALKSQLIRLMAHVIKWKSQPELRSRSWAVTIYNARSEIVDIQEETPSLTADVVRQLWDRCFRRARKEAEEAMGERCAFEALSWGEVFEEPCSLLRAPEAAD